MIHLALDVVTKGIEAVYELFSRVFDRFIHVFDSFPTWEVWEAYLPSDINFALHAIVILLCVLAVFGLARKLVVFFG